MIEMPKTKGEPTEKELKEISEDCDREEFDEESEECRECPLNRFCPKDE